MQIINGLRVNFIRDYTDTCRRLFSPLTLKEVRLTELKEGYYILPFLESQSFLQSENLSEEYEYARILTHTAVTNPGPSHC